MILALALFAYHKYRKRSDPNPFLRIAAVHNAARKDSFPPRYSKTQMDLTPQAQDWSFRPSDQTTETWNAVQRLSSVSGKSAAAGQPFSKVNTSGQSYSNIPKVESYSLNALESKQSYVQYDTQAPVDNSNSNYDSQIENQYDGQGYLDNQYLSTQVYNYPDSDGQNYVDYYEAPSNNQPHDAQPDLIEGQYVPYEVSNYYVANPPEPVYRQDGQYYYPDSSQSQTQDQDLVSAQGVPQWNNPLLYPYES